MAYNGTTVVASGLTQSAGLEFPVASAKDIYVDDNTRLDKALKCVVERVYHNNGNSIVLVEDPTETPVNGCPVFVEGSNSLSLVSESGTLKWKFFYNGTNYYSESGTASTLPYSITLASEDDPSDSITLSYEIRGKGGTSAAPVAPSTNPEDRGKTADAYDTGTALALTPIYSQTPTFSEWTIVTNPNTSGYSVHWNDVGAGSWVVITPSVRDIETGNTDRNAVSLGPVFDFGRGVEITATRDRTDIIGYTLGNQSNKPLASEAEAEALRNEVALRPTRAEMDNGWWSEWMATFDGPHAAEWEFVSATYIADRAWWKVVTNQGEDIVEGAEDASVLQYDADMGAVHVTLRRHRVAAPVPTKPEDIGAQPLLTFDQTPTANSANPVTSGGVKSALDDKASMSDAMLTERGPNKDGFSSWDILHAPLTAEQKATFADSHGASDNDYAVSIQGSSLYVGSFEACVVVLSQDGLSATYVDGIDAAQAIWGPLGTTVATRTALHGYQLGNQSDKPLASEAEAEALRQGKADRAANTTAGNLAALDAQGNPTDSKIPKSDIESLLFAQYYPDGSVKSAAKFRSDIEYNFDTTNHTATVKPFCNTNTAENDNSSLVGRVVIPPFVDEQGNPYISDNGTRFKVVGVSGGTNDYHYNTNLTAVIAPNTVTSIDGSAFRGCESLQTISIPAVTSIGDYAFYECFYLQTISMPVVTNIGVYAFGHCTRLALNSLSILQIIRESAFSYCYSLSNISLPIATNLEAYAFYDCAYLISVSLPAVENIGMGAFGSCASLEFVDFGDTPRSSVPTLDSDAFASVPNTCKIVVPDAQYDAWTAPTLPDESPNPWYALVTANYKFLRHSEWEYARRYELADMSGVMPLVEKSYSELLAMVNGGTLVPGQQYRITDYVATVANSIPTAQSANHPFDLIVTADSTSKLNEEARAILHNGDTYFQATKFEAWRVWYCITNDSSRFSWAATNGKGVIYRLIDEFGNDAPYDFKGIQFKAYGDSDNVWRYTFDSGTASNNTDYSLSGYTNSVYGNRIGPVKFLAGVNSVTRKLNRIVFKGVSNFCNTFESDCEEITLGAACQYNTFDNGCYVNSLGGGCSSNSFRYGCINIILGNYCGNNNFGEMCDGITLGELCIGNTFGSYCREISFKSGENTKNYVSYVTVESGNQYIKMNLTGTATDVAPYRNVTIKSGLNNTTTEKTITDPTNGGQTFHTTIQPANSRTIEY